MIIKFDFKDDNLNNLWVSYQEKKEVGLKKEANKLLNKVVDELRRKDDKLKTDFVKDLLGKVYDEGTGFELQYPLLKQIIFPVLVNEFKKKSMPDVRWLCQIPYIDVESSLEIDRLVNNSNTREELLLLALDLDKGDKIAQELLLKYYINYLDFSIHEIPDGLLCTVEEGLDVISKAYRLIDKYNFDAHKIHEVNELLEFCKILITEWKNFRSQSEISNFDSWCDEHNFDYTDCRARIWEIQRTHF